MTYIKQKLKTIYPIFFLLTSLVLFQACVPKNLAIARIEGKQINVDSTFQLQPEVEAFVEPYRKSLEKEMDQVLAYAPNDLHNFRKEQETPLGNFIADMSYKRGNQIFNKRTGKTIDFALMNIGGIRAMIQKGNVTVRNAYEIMPFENSLVVAELSYEKIQELLQFLADSGNPHPISHQLHVVFNGKNIESALLNGAPFEPKKTYFVLTYDYLLNGGDNMSFFQNPVSSYVLDYKVRSAMIDELRELDTISAKVDGRMIRK